MNIYVKSSDEYKASVSMVRRIRVMAEFIRDKYPNEFDAYWAQNWIGKAEAGEVLEFFSRRDLEHMIVLSRAVEL